LSSGQDFPPKTHKRTRRMRDGSIRLDIIVAANCDAIIKTGSSGDQVGRTAWCAGSLQSKGCLGGIVTTMLDSRRHEKRNLAKSAFPSTREGTRRLCTPHHWRRRQ